MSRPRVYRTQAVVIRRMDYGEADRILTVVTPHHGKLRLIAKGVRRPTSKLGGHLELFNHADLVVARGRDLDVVTQAVTMRAFPSLYVHLDRVVHAYQAAELVDNMVAERAESFGIFLLFVRFLASVDDGVDPRVALRHFELRLLAAAGYRPQLQECVACRQAVEPTLNFFSYRLGGVLCPRCGAKEPAAVPVGVPTLKVLRLVERAGDPREIRVVIPGSVLQEVARLLREYLEQIIDRRLRSPDLLVQTGRWYPSLCESQEPASAQAVRATDG